MTAQPAAALAQPVGPPAQQARSATTAAGVDAPMWQLPPSAAHLVLAAARQRGLPEPDRVEFEAACPACGQDCWWGEERDDTRVQVSVDCPCA